MKIIEIISALLIVLAIVFSFHYFANADKHQGEKQMFVCSQIKKINIHGIKNDKIHRHYLCQSEIGICFTCY